MGKYKVSSSGRIWLLSLRPPTTIDIPSDFTQQKAKEYGITGFVKNENDGTVMISRARLVVMLTSLGPRRSARQARRSQKVEERPQSRPSSSSRREARDQGPRSEGGRVILRCMITIPAASGRCCSLGMVRPHSHKIRVKHPASLWQHRTRVGGRFSGLTETCSVGYVRDDKHG